MQTIRVELLDHFVCFGIDHLRYIIKIYVRFYNEFRPHQGRNNRTLLAAASCEEPATIPFTTGRIECQSELGGLLKHYYRVAA